MKNPPKFLFAAVGFFLCFIFAYGVFAAGGGGGGSGENSPPPPQPSPPAEPPSSPSPPAPAPVPPPAPTCTEDTWSCVDWGACQMNGHQTRTCTFTNDCPGVDTPVPSQDQGCAGLKCGQLETLRERVKCRLELTPEELSAEYAILYFPEYCKVEGTPAKQQACIALYRSLQPCWKMPFGKERAACGRRTVGLKNSIAAETARCKKKKTPVAQKACLHHLDDKRENHTLFRMYEYEWRAEEARKAGKAELDAVVDFDVFVEQTKQAVEEAESRQARSQLLQKIKTRFSEFL